MGILDMVAKSMEIQEEQFMAFERVRKSGATNMFAIREVCSLSGLDRDEVKNIMKNYSTLKAKYLGEEA